MAIIVRITSADGKKVIAKKLPALPSHVKVPAGATVDVVDQETGQRMSLGQYINAHSRDERDGKHGETGTDKVTIETVKDFAAAEDWLNTAAGTPTTEYTASTGTASNDQWFATDSGKKDGEVLGYSKDTLIIGGLVGGGAAIGAVALSGGGGGDKVTDTTGPAAPTGIALAAADDTGTSSTDGITKNTTGLTINGLAEAGSSVEVFNGTTSLGKVTASATGAFTIDVDLAEGVHSIVARATDIFGNVGRISTAYSLTVDTTPPAVPTGLALAAADDTGLSATDGITSKTSGLTITGTAVASGKVELFDGTTSLGTVTAGTDGKFTLDIALTEGTHQITAKTTDVAGNLSEASTALQLVIDTTAPLPPSQLRLAPEDDDGISNSDGITTKTSGLTITGTSEAGARIELFDGTTSLGTFFADTNGNFAKDISLTLGTHSITARVTDLVGNTTAGTSALELNIVAEHTTTMALFDSSTTHFG